MNVPYITVPPHPLAAIVTGACEYGLDMDTVTTRVLKWTYGVKITDQWVSVITK